MDIEKAIIEIVDQRVTKNLSDKGIALRLLNDFAEVDFLTFDEAAAVYRLSEEEMLNAIKSGKIKANKYGKNPSSWRFSKRLIFDDLIGKPEPQREKVYLKDDLGNMALELLS